MSTIRSESAANLCLASRVAVRQSFQSAHIVGAVGVKPGELARRMAGQPSIVVRMLRALSR